MAAAERPVTFHKDVLPILQHRCQSCHRPGEVAPMSLLTYEESRPWAKAIRAAVVQRKMPPWFADPAHG
ncbi:MAG: thiol-disulfide isomerase, partial [Acidobacteria bacterium]